MSLLTIRYTTGISYKEHVKQNLLLYKNKQNDNKNSVLSYFWISLAKDVMFGMAIPQWVDFSYLFMSCSFL